MQAAAATGVSSASCVAATDRAETKDILKGVLADCSCPDITRDDGSSQINFTLVLTVSCGIRLLCLPKAACLKYETVVTNIHNPGPCFYSECKPQRTRYRYHRHRDKSVSSEHELS